MKTQIIEVPFRSDSISAIQVDGVVYVAMRPICENIGIDWAGQSVKLNREKDKFNCCDISTVAADGKNRRTLCIPLKKLNGWLFSINPNKVRSDIKASLVAYQEECFTALHDYFTKGEAKRGKATDRSRYNVRVIIRDDLTGTAIELNGEADSLRDVAGGISTDLGFKPHAFTHIPIAREKIRRLY